MLSYFKKLCVHPVLLNSSSLDQKKSIGIITLEEELILNEQDKIRAETAANYVGI